MLTQMKHGDFVRLERTIRDHNQGALAAYLAGFDAPSLSRQGGREAM